VKALITGVTGFAGAYLAEHLLDCGDRVLGCAERLGWHEDVPGRIRDKVELFEWDISHDFPAGELARVERFAPDCIFHLAAISYPADCGQEHPTPGAIAVNVDGTRRVVELAVKLASRPRVLLTSSAYVYAPVDSRRPHVDEQAPVGPTHPYGVTKVAAEQIVFRAVAEQALDGLIARAFQHTGPRHEAHYLLPEWARQFAASEDGPIRVRSLNTYLDLTDVRDQVRAYRELAVKGQAGAVYNVGSGVNRNAAELIEVLQSYFDRPRTVIETCPNGSPQQNPIANSPVGSP
jgi:GDP-4-dehydro-6-deoxy-D-mannose reductase